MRILKEAVLFCFLAIIVLIFLSHAELSKAIEYKHELYDISPYYTGCRAVDVAVSSFYYLLKSPTATSDLLIFIYYVGVVITSYTGLVLGLLVAVSEREKRSDFLFILSFISCAFFAIFTTVIAIII